MNGPIVKLHYGKIRCSVYVFFFFLWFLCYKIDSICFSAQRTACIKYYVEESADTGEFCFSCNGTSIALKLAGILNLCGPSRKQLTDEC